MSDRDATMAAPAAAVFERMADYATRMERSPPPVFVGREAELRELRLAALVVAEDDNQPRGMTRVVQGVPGAGKSALCDEFLNALHGREIGGRRALCAKMSPDTLDVPPLRLVAAINEELLRTTHERLPGVRGRLAAGGRQLRRLGSVAAQLHFKSSEYRLNDELHGLTEETPLGTCINAYAEHMWPDDVIVVLGIDEMQNCPVTPRTKAVLRVLNERLHGSHILLTCFGLQYTATVMREDLGLSRMANDSVIEIGTLHPGEGRQVLERTLDHLGLAADNAGWRDYVEQAGFGHASPWAAWRKALVDDLETRSGDFPQHLTAALRAVCLTLGENCDAYSPEHALFAKIAERHEANKADYYHQRLGPDLARHQSALGAIVRAATACSDGRVAAEDAVAAFAMPDARGRAIDVDAADNLLDIAIRRGVLREVVQDGKAYCQPPAIPSMSIHLSALFDRQLARRDGNALALAERLGL